MDDKPKVLDELGFSVWGFMKKRRHRKGSGVVAIGESRIHEPWREQEKVSKKRKPSKKSSKGIRAQLFYIGHRHCFWCDKQVTAKTGTLEHGIPKSRDKQLSRLQHFHVMACKTCNHSRDNGEYPICLSDKIESLWVNLLSPPSTQTHAPRGQIIARLRMLGQPWDYSYADDDLEHEFYLRKGRT